MKQKGVKAVKATEGKASANSNSKAIKKGKKKRPILFLYLNSQTEKLFNDVREMLGEKTLTKTALSALTSFLSNKKTINDLENRLASLNQIIEEKDTLIDNIREEVLGLKEMEEEQVRITKRILEQKERIEKITKTNKVIKKRFGY